MEEVSIPAAKRPENQPAQSGAEERQSVGTDRAPQTTVRRDPRTPTIKPMTPELSKNLRRRSYAQVTVKHAQLPRPCRPGIRTSNGHPVAWSLVQPQIVHRESCDIGISGGSTPLAHAVIRAVVSSAVLSTAEEREARDLQHLPPMLDTYACIFEHAS